MDLTENFNKNPTFQEKILIEAAYRSRNFNDVPPIIGVIIADINGRAIVAFEYDTRKSKYGSIKNYLNSLDFDLISMYFSAFNSFATDTNIKNLSHLEVHGSNIKLKIYFLFNKFIIILPLNSHTTLLPEMQVFILSYFNKIISEHEEALMNSLLNDIQAKNIIINLKNKGKKWLEELNRVYLQKFKGNYLKKQLWGDEFFKEINPLIKNDLDEYLPTIPEEIKVNLLKEISSKIQDKLIEFSKDTLVQNKT